MKKFKPALLAREIRSGLVELEYYGFVVYCKSQNRKKIFTTIGETNDYPFFHRSCAKPLQAALACDLKTFEHFNLNAEEIAVCCASHAGEETHIKVLKNILKKGALKESDIKCPLIPPLNNFEGIKEFSPLHNNCSGKHILMLLICRQLGLETKDYLNQKHPVQLKILEKIKELCETKEELPLTLDGCMAPNWATSLEQLNTGFSNLANQYPGITNSMMSNPYTAGGKNRLDTHIMQIAPQICAKVGAGGLCAVTNTVLNESFVIKVIDADMKARTVITLEMLRQLNWLNINSIDTNLLNEFFDDRVYTQTGEIIGKYETVFSLP